MRHEIVTQRDDSGKMDRMAKGGDPSPKELHTLLRCFVRENQAVLIRRIDDLLNYSCECSGADRLADLQTRYSYTNASLTLTRVARSAGHKLANVESTITINNQATTPPTE
jgi:hypothetical protein